MKKKNNKKQLGFSLIEVIIYVALISIFIGGAIQFTWDILYGRVKAQVQQEVNQNLRLAVKKISYEIRNASDVTIVGASDISLMNDDDPTRDPTQIDVSNGRLRIGYGNTDPCSVTTPCFLTSDRVTVSNLTFTDLSSGTDSTNIQFSITIDHNNTGGRQEWEKSQTYTTAVELRSN